MKQKGVKVFATLHILLILAVFFYTSAFAETYVSGDIRSDTVWTKAGSPYIVTGGISVYGDTTTGVTLTIEPGVELRFNQNHFLIIGSGPNKGALVAVGTETEPIKFTANTPTPSRGYWIGIIFRDGTMDETSIMEHCVVEYAGYATAGDLYLESASPTIRNCQIRESSGYGINCSQSSPTIENNTISANSKQGIFLGSGSSPNIIGNRVDGIDSNTSSISPQIQGNTFTNYHNFPLRLGANLIGQVEEENTFEGINVSSDLLYVIGERISKNATWKNLDIRYIIEGGISVYGDTTTGVTLTMEPGVELRFNQNHFLNIGSGPNKGALVAVGTETEPIKFTANTPSPGRGYWQGIYFHDGTMDATSIMEHCVVEYAGYFSSGDLYLTSASPTIRSCQIRESSGNGINCYQSSPTIENNTISANSSYGVYCSNIESFPTIIGNTFSNNGSYPLRVGANMMNQVSNNIYTNNGNQALEIMGDRITQNVTYKNVGLPYIITGGISVYGDTTTGVTLTMEPGVELRFNQNNNLNIGSGPNKGALVAVGTETEPIKFTANTPSPSRGYWIGIYFHDGTMDATSIMEHCVVEYAGYFYSGDLYLESASPTIRSCQIRESSGHGINCYESSPTIENTVINNNSSWGVYCSNSSPSITNCTFNTNAGGVYCSSSSPVITNCILWGNQPNELSVSGGTPAVTYSDIQGGYSGEGNIDGDPLFINPVAGNYHLQFGSPCIDRGTSNGAPAVDKDGLPRPSGAGYDMGAYEFCSATIYEDGEDGLTNGWNVYDANPAGAQISNVFDADRGSRVIVLSGSGTANGYSLRNQDGTLWNNTGQFVVQWSMNYAEPFIVYLLVNTDAGRRYLTYIAADTDSLGGATYIYHGLGSGVADGQWHTFTRDLQADLQAAQPGVSLLSVDGFLIRGSGMVDDISLMDEFPAGLDSDADGLTDIEETTYGTNPSRPDTDNDGLSDGDEVHTYLTDPTDADTDNDGFIDGVEISQGTNPNNPASYPVASIYEDGEDGLTNGWNVYDANPAGAQISNMFDADRGSRVIVLSGSGTANGYSLRNQDSTWWNNTQQFVVQWSMNYAEPFIVYLLVNTDAGMRYLTYIAADTDYLGGGNYIYHGLGSSAKDGQWHTFTRDLQADLHEAQPGVSLLSVDGFLIRGSGMVDDISLMNTLP